LLLRPAFHSSPPEDNCIFIQHNFRPNRPPEISMSYSDPRRRQHERVTRWLAAIRQHAAWLYAADEQYVYLVGEANELNQCGVVGLQDRHDMVTDALGMYSWAIEHSITRETH
ncbi:hypothetical protein, partial [Enterococcus faecium]|uniref:hypothetical protein n=1 Tax=Enterococcus faecium TaxID=1352 RepID=UPI003CC6943B